MRVKKASHWVFFGQTAQNAEHNDEHRHLGQQWQTRSQRVHLVLLVELHHLFVQLLAITFVLILQLLHLWLKTLHFQHSLGALHCERSDEQHDGKRHNGNCYRVTVHPPVGGVDEPCACLKHIGAFLGSPSRGRYLVDSGWPEWSTTDQSANSEPQPTDRSVGFNGFHRIVRTAGVEAAWRRTAFARYLVERNCLQHQTLWFCEMLVVGADVGAHFEVPEHLARRESR